MLLLPQTNLLRISKALKEKVDEIANLVQDVNGRGECTVVDGAGVTPRWSRCQYRLEEDFQDDDIAYGFNCAQ